MKRYSYLLCLIGVLLLIPTTHLSAQVEKEVEVSKQFVPKVATATKPAMEPRFTDTVKIRPEIDYTIRPRALNTQLEPRTYRPATVTYWEFNRPTPFYLKAGIGYPLNSMADFQMAAQNPSIGYALVKVNHLGDYARVRNHAGTKPNSTRLYNRIGGAAGRYLGRHILEGELYYENRLFHRYGATDPQDELMVGSRVNFGEAGMRVRIGDDFNDNRKVNFNLEGYGIYFHDNSQTLSLLDARQIDGGGAGKIGFRWGEHRIGIALGFEGAWGAAEMSECNNLNLHGGIGYTFSHRQMDAEVGVEYHYSSIRIAGVQEGFHYPIPHIRLKFNLGNGAFVPFVGFDGEVERNDFRSLMHENPYLITGLALPKNTAHYNLRFGTEGEFASRFSYRIFAELSWIENARYWYGINFPQAAEPTHNFLQFGIEQARRNTATLGLDLKWRPVADLLIQGSLQGYLHDFRASLYDQKLGGGLPALRSSLKIEYTHRKFTLALSGEQTSTRYWSNLRYFTDTKGASRVEMLTYKVPITVNLNFYADYHLNSSLTLFAEGRNLLNQRLHDWANYPLTGIACTAGIKLNF